ncbi:MAG: gamma-glutamylcyclotransferase [Planctomycetaceae bacterium]|jgi:gamma-glutamylcyclotransferase|nr:gamma-glutamylcyclotransferase [Planctomycetaceae bacterium]MBT6155531.1 gamma-glutamylcyclotransferase [Planctomycetaceae bacterium]MBT6485061.1 gamma-glutamylcyclotransferase [Planctomycetaceae bacterium]MBT6493644.1 gamma-glutamylcyclotransferase [Planctomycetaceae bacterium]
MVNSPIHVFAYGSNMCTERLRARVASAAPLAIGYVTRRRLAFHKRGNDGSAKADAVYTGRIRDCVWGVVFSLRSDEKSVLDEFEIGYHEEQVVVIGKTDVLHASVYVASDETVDASLSPFCWYHRFVVQGAKQHRLPTDYVQQLQGIESVTDHDGERLRRNSLLLDGR